ncbi:MAG: porin [Gammaproteobacteria bacterium]|nr:porin [Gammaproteobacteria bacterium]
MKKHLGYLATGLMLITTNLHAGSIKTESVDLDLSGGVSGSFFTSNNTGSKVHDNLQISDIMLELKTGKIKKTGVGFTIGLGGYTPSTLYDGGMMPGFITDTTQIPLFSDTPRGFNHGWLSVAPMKDLAIDIGVIPTTIGLEQGVSYANGNILRGVIWNAQPGYYRGLRANYSIDDIKVFVEFNNDASQGSSKSFALGADAKIDDMKVGGTFLYGDGGNNIFDVIFTMKIDKSIDVGANLDLFIVESPQVGASSSVFGLALYANARFDDISVPVRLEYANSGTGNTVYGYNGGGIGTSAYSITVTPTYNFSKETYVRADLALIGTDAKIFTDKSFPPSESMKMSFALQTGYKF